MVHDLWLLALLASLAQHRPNPPPGPINPPLPLASSWSLEGMEDQCSVEGMHFDLKCLEAILIDIGYQPAVVVRHNPDGSGTETTLHLKPDWARAEALMQQACGYRLWQSCMQYVVFLKDGKHFSKGEERWRELLQWVCSRGFTRGCKMLRDDHLPIAPPLQDPILAWTGNARGPTKLPARIEQPEEARPAPAAVPAAKQAESEGVAKIRAMLKAKCDQGDPGSCNALPKDTQSPRQNSPSATPIRNP